MIDFDAFRARITFYRILKEHLLGRPRYISRQLLISYFPLWPINRKNVHDSIIAHGCRTPPSYTVAPDADSWIRYFNHYGGVRFKAWWFKWYPATSEAGRGRIISLPNRAMTPELPASCLSVVTRNFESSGFTVIRRTSLSRQLFLCRG